jgi:hypothetical protein
MSPEKELDIVVFEADLSYAHGKSTNNLEKSEKVVFNKTEFSGPLKLTTTYELLNALVGFRVGKRFDAPFGVEFNGGANLLGTDIAVASNSISNSKRSFNGGPYIGGKVTCLPTDNLTFYIQMLIMPSPHLLHVGDIGGTLAGVGLSYKVFKYASVFVDWRDYDVTIHKPIEESDINLNVSGPRFGVEMTF